MRAESGTSLPELLRACVESLGKPQAVVRGEKINKKL